MKTKIVIISIMVIVLVTICYYFMSINLSEVNANKLKTLKATGKPYEIIVYHIDGNATIQNSIQVRTLRNDNEEKVLANYALYDSLLSVNATKTSLQLILEKPGPDDRTIDTVYLKLP